MNSYEEIARALTEEQRAACHVPVAPVARGRERCSAHGGGAYGCASPYPCHNHSAFGCGYAEETNMNKKAPRRTTSEKAQHEESAPLRRGVSTAPGASAQLPPLAADLEGLAVSLGILAGNVTPDQWEFVKRFRDNLRAAAERVAALETNLEAPHA